MVLKHTGILSLILLLVAACWLGSVTAEPPAVLPKTAFTFSSVDKWPTHQIDVDRSKVKSYTSKSGETFVGAVFQVIMTEPMVVSSGAEVKTFVNVVVAKCGHDTTLLLNSKSFKPNGELLVEVQEPETYDDFKQESTPVTEMYKFLCANVQKPKPNSQDKPSNKSEPSNSSA